MTRRNWKHYEKKEMRNRGRTFVESFSQLANAHPETEAPEVGKIHGLWSDTKNFLDPIFVDNAPV